MKQIQLLLVVETNVMVKSDDAYYAWILKNYFSGYVSSQGENGLRIRYGFIYMDGKTNYDSARVKREIASARENFKRSGETRVVYCFDVDNTTRKNADFLERVIRFCKANGYCLSVAFREIEEVLDIPSLGSKHDRVLLFRQKYPRKNDFPSDRFFIALPEVTKKRGQTNFGLIIQLLIASELE